MLEAFLTASERRLAPGSIKLYRVRLRPYAAWLELRGAAPETADPDDVADYIATLPDDWSPSTRNTALCAIRALHAWMEREHAVPNVATEVCKPKYVRPRDQPPPSAAAVLAVIRDLDDGTHEGLRDHTIATILYGCGLRISEALGIELSDVALQERRLWVRYAKGDKPRPVPMHDVVARTIRRWIDSGGADGSAFLFPGSGPRGRLARWTFAPRLKRSASRLGYDERLWHPHMLRHACATHLAQADVHMDKLQRLLGHADPSATRRYVRLALRDLHDAIDTHHPIGLRTAARQPVLTGSCTSTADVRITFAA